ncbi:Rpn family recombination-promoting nuclease/putative transposase [Virgibacillus soli]|uniref:Rpn family recombination-promoting nuclease/putative transposase n=1 Tax=Paracerasibacillus soli TaxID=480284 RepID=A0ABU5CNS3_9BACI|nr:Rpn family recombination-promoting nuclease/putative transposase [Virgibacillus soli]MDY0407459.1 Rpn family recombination-promoting nuclease/putative transposase [Virgibacillus soli]
MAQVQLRYAYSFNPLNIMNEDFANYHKKTASRWQQEDMALNKLMDLKIDYAFKQLFGSEENKHIIIAFLNAFLQKADRSRIINIICLNTEASYEYTDEKLSTLNLLVETEQSEEISIEIQFPNKNNIVKHSLFYWSRLYAKSFRKSMNDNEILPVVSIHILNEHIFDQTERFHTIYHLYEDRDKFRLTNEVEVHFIEMPKLLRDWKREKLYPWNDVFVRWLLILGMVDGRKGVVHEDIYKTLREIAMHDKILYSALVRWRNLSVTEKGIRAYESRLKWILDEESSNQA